MANIQKKLVALSKLVAHILVIKLTPVNVIPYSVPDTRTLGGMAMIYDRS
jgi:hypothetical protein